MSQSKSLKTDKEKMWKKLSTLPKPKISTDQLEWLHRRNDYSWKKGELITVMANGKGKSYYGTVPSA